MNTIDIKVKRKSGCEDLSLPRYATDGSSGMDLYADVEGEVVLETGSIQLISTGLYIAVPRGYEAEIRPRSGLALKHGISLVNSPGTIDSDYRGLLSIILINHGKDPFVVKRGERIAQMVIKEVTRARWEEVGELEETVRSSGGFGHSGI